jgi:hypothetical protein
MKIEADVNTIYKDICDIKKDIKSIQVNGTNLCVVHQANLKEAQTLQQAKELNFENALEALKEKIEEVNKENKKAFEKRDKISIAIIIAILTQIITNLLNKL